MSDWLWQPPIKGAYYDQGKYIYRVDSLGAKMADITIFDKNGKHVEGSYYMPTYVFAWEIETNKRVIPSKRR